MTFENYIQEVFVSDKEYQKMRKAWIIARRTDPVKKQMYEALKNIENDDKHMPAAIWAEIQNAIKAAEEP